MCGIAGSCNFRGKKVDCRDIQRMTETLIHRGPNEEGVYISGENHPGTLAQAGLGHRRLSIIDLETGHQPMSNEDGSIWIVFNGEIYNFRELKKVLLIKGHRFKTRSDTEVILHLYEDKDIDCVKDLRGMFAFAIWDTRKERLFIARDRVGKKPLVYHFNGKQLTFASEIKALLQNDIKREVDPNAIDYFLTYGYVPSPRSILKEIRKLPPAHILTYDRDNLKIERYWHINYEKKKISFTDAKEKLKELLTESVSLRLVSDVPLGVFLSGGIDSSTVTALMSGLSDLPVKTFTVGFEEEDYSELEFARMVAKRFSTEHHEFIVKPNVFEVLNKLVWHYNEPFGDSSCIPTYYVAKMARQSVTVALNGDGGDESFAGYARYKALHVGKFFKVIPKPIAYLADSMFKKNRKSFIAIVSSILRALNLEARPRYVEGFLTGLFDYPDEWGRYASWMSCFQKQQKMSLYSDGLQTELENSAEAYIFGLIGNFNASNLVEKAMEVDINSYLPEDLLVKMDIATMSNSLEARSPFLDHKLMEFTASLPADFKMRFLTTKHILRELAKDLLPREILHRKKMGFAIPLDKWFREDLKELAYDMLLDRKCLKRGYFRKEFIKTLLDEHCSGKFSHGACIWNLLNLEIWHRTFIDKAIPLDY